ncbi:hypothetical protein IFM89_005975 [Coptis chinensis]|uniref:Uncharacterized protein n=1 Tax=Coptis chinensis TaxID=261450 RepID=A0A835IUG5_9MAGN|nr:hypothetical protein IFM89_005975 [Coptis chinensis]
MATLEDIGVSAFINILTAFAFLLAFAFLRLQPINDRVYFPKWYITGSRTSPTHSSGRNIFGKFVNLNFKTYLTFLNWMPQALQMSESELIVHAGLDSAVFLRVYLLGLKIFLPVTILALVVLVPVNVSGGTLFFLRKELVVSDIDKLSISNVRPQSQKFWAHISMAYLLTIWTCFVLYKEYDKVAFMRLHYLASQQRRVDQFTNQGQYNVKGAAWAPPWQVFNTNASPAAKSSHDLPISSGTAFCKAVWFVRRERAWTGFSISSLVMVLCGKFGLVVKSFRLEVHWIWNCGSQMDCNFGGKGQSWLRQTTTTTETIGGQAKKSYAAAAAKPKYGRNIDTSTLPIPGKQEPLTQANEVVVLEGIDERGTETEGHEEGHISEPVDGEESGEPSNAINAADPCPERMVGTERAIITYYRPTSTWTGIKQAMEEVKPRTHWILMGCSATLNMVIQGSEYVVPPDLELLLAEHDVSIAALPKPNSGEKDELIWKPDLKGTFSVKSFEEIRRKMPKLNWCKLNWNRPDVRVKSEVNKEVVVRNVPHVTGHSISESVDQFFQTNHPNHYLGHQAVYNANKFAKLIRQRERLHNWFDYNQLKFERHPDKRPTRKTGFLGLWGSRVDSIEFYKQKMQELDKRIESERQRILKDPKSIMPVAFVSFDSRWGAAVCAQTQQSKNPTLWLTDWAPEPRDVYWQNLAIPFVSISIRKLVISISVFALVFFYMIPIAFVQSLANLDGLERVAPFLRPVIEVKVVKSFLQGFLPGLALKIFMYILPTVLMIMSKVEGHLAVSVLERKAAAKFYYFMLVNVFLGSIVTGTAFEQLHSFLHQSPTQIPRTIGVSIPMKATFFITYIMVDGWAGIASEILRLKPLVIFHLKNMFIVKTERDREKAMDPGSVDLPETLPTLQLYFLLGVVYAVVTPILLPFILVFFGFAYLVYRHQIINVYYQQYESVAAFWPYVHSRIIASLLISQLLLLGLLSTKKAANSTPLLVVLPILTIWFHKYCKSRFEPAFRKYPLEEAIAKDTMERSAEPNLDLKAYLADAYLHPIFRSFEDVELLEVRVDKNRSHIDTPSMSELSSPSPPQYMYNYDYEH